MPLRYDNSRIKEPNLELEYTLEQIQELAKCERDIKYFCSNYITIVHPDKGKVKFDLRDYQSEFLDLCDNNRFVVGMMARQAGKSVFISAYAFHYAIFNSDKFIGIASNKEKSAKNILRKIKLMYEEAPIWLKPGVIEWNKQNVEFDNGTRIEVSATSEDSFRGNTINLLILDEFSFVPPGQANAFFGSNYPTISASQDSKIVIISTPNGMFNMFHQIYVGAETGTNAFKNIKVDWRRVPGRDEEWAKQERRNMGEQKFKQEQEVEFLGSTSTVIDPHMLEYLFTQFSDNYIEDLNGRLRIYEKPIEGKEYVLGIDPGKGTGQHDSCIQVLKINSLDPYIDMEQVAVFQSNTTDTYEFSGIVNRLSIYYNKGWIIVENNGEGSVVAGNLHWVFENPNIYNSGNKSSEIGIRATKSTKPTAVINMKKVVDDDSLKLYDQYTIEQLGSFIETKNNNFQGKDLPDDLVSALYWACYVFETQIYEEAKERLTWSNKRNTEENDIWGVLTDVPDYVEEFSWIDDVVW